jgi:hypothetical protein
MYTMTRSSKKYTGWSIIWQTFLGTYCVPSIPGLQPELLQNDKALKKYTLRAGDVAQW